MSLSIATAPKQYVFRRNYGTRKWENLAGDGKTCKIQVSKNPGSGEHMLKITPDDGENKQPREHKLSSENRVHFSDGFIQVPVADSKELYGIKFKDVIQGEEFYMRMVKALGLPRSYPKTTIGDDGNPNPIGSGGGPPQQAPMTIAGGQVPRGQIFRAPEPQVGAVPVLPPYHSVKLPPSMQRAMDPAPYEEPQPQPRQRAATYGDKAAPLHHHQQQLHQQQQHHQQPLPNHFNHVSPEQGNFAPPQRQQQQPQKQQMMFEHSLHAQPGLSERKGGGGGYVEQPHVVSSQPFVGQPVAAGKASSKDMFDGPPPQPAAATQYGAGMRPGSGGGGTGMGPSGVSGLGPGSGGGGGGQPSGRLQPSPSKRRPMSMGASDIQSVAESMVDAVNQGDESRSKHMLDILLRFMKEPDGEGKFALNFDNPRKTPPKSSSFTLNIQVEFQQPNKDPVPIFLYDVTADDSITVLSARVEQEFYIPKLSQNWIIGSRLVKGNDTNKPLKELGVKGDGIGEVNVFMYVMHTKKAQVPNEAVRVRQQQHRQQQQQQQQVLQRQMQGGAGQGQPGGQPGGGFQQQHSGVYRGQNISVVDDQATYSRLDNRGYNPLAAPQQQQPFQRCQQFEGVDDPTYSRLDEFQRPDPQVINRGTAPRQQQQLMMMQQGGGGGSRMGIGQPRMGMGPNPAGPNMPQQYNQQPSGQMLAQMQYQEQKQQQQLRQQPMNAHSYLGVPDQLQMAPQQQQQPAPQQPPAHKPAPAKPKEPQGWVCTKCTLVNNPRRPGCELCSAPRPENYVVPEEAPLADFERKAKENEALFEQTWKMQAEERYKEMVNADNSELVTNQEMFMCQICYLEVEAGEGIVLRDCLHQFCRECIKESVMHSNEAEVKCPFNDKYECNAVISEREIRACVTDKELQAYHKRILSQAESALPNSFHCKTPDCRGWCINEDEVNEFHCPVCNKRNCILCKAIHEGMNCKEYQDDMKRKAENDEAAKATQEMLEKLVKNGEAMKCPKCEVVVQKKEGCDWIRCSMCKTEICWATKGPRWGPNGRGDISGGCRCRVNGKKCHPLCRNCH